MPSFSNVKPVLFSLHHTKWMFWIKLSVWCRTTVLYINVRPCRNDALSSSKRLLLSGKTVWKVLNLCSCLCSLLQHPSSHKRQLGFRKIVYWYVHLINLTLKANLLNEVYFCDEYVCLLWIAQVHWKSFCWPADTSKAVSMCSGLRLEICIVDQNIAGWHSLLVFGHTSQVLEKVFLF